ncbi:hypothetical protein KY290_000011 [Solanum tuberosum]|uniref:Uncharacterized protein n=1 Tax=Solanum tuberosum TaxID=4113 RepID=A0ABQ7WI39_SOLTU|nr:hypothetical protein KY289_000012 [Solanum tuberosum]KAH0780413.1 hypothetical protein KY290_000011 [Solanum tuberosum]
MFFLGGSDDDGGDQSGGAIIGSPSNVDCFDELLHVKALQQQRFAAASQFMASGADLIFGLLTGSVDYFNAFGDAEPPVSSISLLVSTLLVFTVGLVGIFDIGEGNDMPARKSMDEKMMRSENDCPLYYSLDCWTDSLSVPWYTNLLPFHDHEDTLSAILVFSTSLRICYMALHLHKSIVVLNSVEELDQPFKCNHQPMLWLGKQKGIFVLHLSYGSVITLLPNGIEIEKHEGGIVMNGPGPVWANQLNTELRDYVWDSS